MPQSPDSTRITKFYFFTIINSQFTVERGSKPRLSEVGPFGAVRDVFKYDIRFSTQDDSRCGATERVCVCVCLWIVCAPCTFTQHVHMRV